MLQCREYTVHSRPDLISGSCLVSWHDPLQIHSNYKRLCIYRESRFVIGRRESLCRLLMDLPEPFARGDTARLVMSGREYVDSHFKLYSNELGLGNPVTIVNHVSEAMMNEEPDPGTFGQVASLRHPVSLNAYPLTTYLPHPYEMTSHYPCCPSNLVYRV